MGQILDVTVFVNYSIEIFISRWVGHTEPLLVMMKFGWEFRLLCFRFFSSSFLRFLGSDFWFSSWFDTFLYRVIDNTMSLLPKCINNMNNTISPLIKPILRINLVFNMSFGFITPNILDFVHVEISGFYLHITSASTGTYDAILLMREIFIGCWVCRWNNTSPSPSSSISSRITWASNDSTITNYS